MLDCRAAASHSRSPLQDGQGDVIVGIKQPVAIRPEPPGNTHLRGRGTD